MKRGRVDLFQKAWSFTRAKEIQANGMYPYFKAIESGAGPKVFIGGREYLMFGSNNYLGLTQNERVRRAAKEAIDRYGSGCTGSRFLNGTLKIHEETEARLAAFVRKPRALMFSTGFQVNLGVISTLVGRDDSILCDRMNHASIIEGCRLAFGRTIKYRHNDIYDLERILNSVEFEDNAGGTLVATDGVFSMEGDLANLPGLVALKKKYPIRIMLDDAHGIGVMGPNGRGTAEHFGVESEIDLIMGTFSKSFGSLGGFIAGEEPIVEYVKHHARALIFSASMPPSNVATVLTALDIMEKEPEHHARLWENTRRLQQGLRQLGFDIGRTETPVIPVLLRDFALVMNFWKDLFEAGIFVNPIVPPGIAEELSLLRTSTMASHTPAMIGAALDAFERIGKKHKVIR
jgi:8-amino-7-oxononanoate synthase